jgi:hypothetical protein
MFTQLIQGSQLESRLIHIESGEELVSITDMLHDVTLDRMNRYQSWGAGLTYWRRYCLSSLLGIITDTDNDAADIKSQPPSQPTKKQIQVNTELFDYAVKRYGEGISRNEMQESCVIGDSVWKAIVKAHNKLENS